MYFVVVVATTVNPKVVPTMACPPGQIAIHKTDAKAILSGLISELHVL